MVRGESVSTIVLNSSGEDNNELWTTRDTSPLDLGTTQSLSGLGDRILARTGRMRRRQRRGGWQRKTIDKEKRFGCERAKD
jgi:hypothetical protein